ncbi:MAG: cupin domain-containing protein [Nannocystis sp.]|nr:cupin domain-containing protein [Nannocystis sp.]
MSAQQWRPVTAEPTSAGEVDLVTTLGLAPHVEGGYYRELWASRERVHTRGGPRPRASTIYYLLTTEAPLGRFHRNVSDITHLLHRGGPLVYQLISPEGAWREVVLGHDHRAGQVLAFICPGGWWKSSQLLPGAPDGLISEIVAPGFDYADHQIADEALFTRLFPQLRARWTGCVRGSAAASAAK